MKGGLLTKSLPVNRFEYLVSLISMTESALIRALIFAACTSGAQAQPSEQVVEVVSGGLLWVLQVLVTVLLVLVSWWLMFGGRRPRTREVSVQATPDTQEYASQIFEEYFPDCTVWAQVATQTDETSFGLVGPSRSSQSSAGTNSNNNRPAAHVPNPPVAKPSPPQQPWIASPSQSSMYRRDMRSSWEPAFCLRRRTGRHRVGSYAERR